MQTSFVLLTPEQVRESIEKQQHEGESFTATVNRVAAELGISRRALFNYIERGVTARVDATSVKMLQQAAQQNVAPDWIQLRSFLTSL